jgi:hypothetical protein
MHVNESLGGEPLENPKPVLIRAAAQLVLWLLPLTVAHATFSSCRIWAGNDVETLDISRQVWRMIRFE